MFSKINIIREARDNLLKLWTPTRLLENKTEGTFLFLNEHVLSWFKRYFLMQITEVTDTLEMSFEYNAI